MHKTRADAEVDAAIQAASEPSIPEHERAEMLVAIATGLQTRPKSPDQLHQAIELYDRALALVADDRLAAARITARRGTALQALPEPDGGALQQARQAFEEARPVVAASGEALELAELDLNLGLCLQSLAGQGKAPLADAIKAYQRALRVFDKAKHPKDYAILHNNLATAFLAMPFADGRASMREALAVQSFEEGLSVVNLIDHPNEYAMLQNNLGNALQYAVSAHPVANNLRAIEAYDEALKVRNRRDSPLAYANTIANKANCLANLPDDPDRPAAGNPANLAAAVALYREARAIFTAQGEPAKAEIVEHALAELGAAGLDHGGGFGQALAGIGLADGKQENGAA